MFHSNTLTNSAIQDVRRKRLLSGFETIQVLKWGVSVNKWSVGSVVMLREVTGFMRSVFFLSEVKWKVKWSVVKWSEVMEGSYGEAFEDKSTMNIFGFTLKVG